MFAQALAGQQYEPFGEALRRAGQICMPTVQIVTLGAEGDRFDEACANKVESLTAGDPRDGDQPLPASA